LVLYETVNELRERHPELFTDEAFATIGSNLKARHDRLLQDFGEEQQGREQVLATLDEIQASIHALPVGSKDFGAFYGGVKKVYKRGRKAATTARNEPSTENLHDWRKRAKYLYYIMGYLRFLWPGELKALEATLGDLADLLGADHDLAVLCHTLEKEPALLQYPEKQQLLSGVISLERQGKQEQLRPLAHRLFKETPAQFSNRLAAYWEAVMMESEQ
jgi:CHAD domain-containing protein